jgi:hypothetical protein
MTVPSCPLTPTVDQPRLMDIMPAAALKAYLYAWRLARPDGLFYVSNETLAQRLGLQHRNSGGRR